MLKLDVNSIVYIRAVFVNFTAISDKNKRKKYVLTKAKEHKWNLMFATLRAREFLSWRSRDFERQGRK